MSVASPHTTPAPNTLFLILAVGVGDPIVQDALLQTWTSYQVALTSAEFHLARCDPVRALGEQGYRRCGLAACHRPL